jgi:hypothetical protein
MSKYIEVTHGFVVDDDVTSEQISNLVGTMTVQVEEPVVGYSDDMGMNELTIETSEIHSAWRPYPLMEVWIVSHVAGLDGRGESSTGGFNWWPAATTSRLDALRYFQDEVNAWTGEAARVRLLKRHVPLLSYVANEKLDNLSEDARTRITAWLDSRLEDVEYRWPAERVRLVFHNKDTEERAFSDLLHLTRGADEHPNAIPYHYYRPHPDEITQVKMRLSDTPPDIGDALSSTLGQRFPEVVQELLDEQEKLMTPAEVDQRVLHIVNEWTDDEFEQAFGFDRSGRDVEEED